MKEPKLLFALAPQDIGYPCNNLTSYRDLKPSTVVRELLQNSMDAATAAGRQKTIVQFRLFDYPLKNIPGIEQYKEKFNKTNPNEKGHQETAKQIIKRIQEQLGKESIQMLSVLDNGIGLNAKTMGALLSDGKSEKEESSSAGSFGNGHYASIPTSDLRYLLYGGLHKNKKICSGHAILASHEDDAVSDKQPVGADGFFLIEQSNDCNKKFTTEDNTEAFPKLIDEELERIRTHWGNGSAIIIAAFNFFDWLDKDPSGKLKNRLFQAAACNFLPAIEQERLEVQFVDSNSSYQETLNKKNLDKVLDLCKDQPRSGNIGGLPGERANEVLATLRHGEHEEVQMQIGTVKIYINFPQDDKGTRISLFRNGMWIVEKQNMDVLRGALADRKSFHACLLLDPPDKAGRSSDGTKSFYELVKYAEGPLHNSLRKMSLTNTQERKLFIDELKSIVAWFQNKIPEISAESHSPEGFLEVDPWGGGSNQGKDANSLSLSGEITPVLKRTSAIRTLDNSDETVDFEIDDDNHPNPKPEPPTPKPKQKPSRKIFPIQAYLTQTHSQCRIELKSQKQCKNAILSVKIDENNNATCDMVWQENEVILKKICIDSQELPINETSKNGQGIPIGDIDSDKACIIEIEYECPGNFVLTELGQTPTLKIELFQEKTPRKKETESD